MEKYRANVLSSEIEKIDITRETESSVMFMKDGKERREAKESQYWKWLDSREDAIDYLIACKTKKVDEAKWQLEYRQEQLAVLLEKYLPKTFQEAAAEFRAKHPDAFTTEE